MSKGNVDSNERRRMRQLFDFLCMLAAQGAPSNDHILVYSWEAASG